MVNIKEYWLSSIKYLEVIDMTDPINARIKPNQKTVGTTAVKLVLTNLPGRKSMVISNEGANKIYIGSSTVTSANGEPIAPGASKGFDFGDAIDVYARTSSGTSDTRILEGA